ncbi:hypothetical protein Desde_1346 [Desulfitobacterium dehalogenans ATCC 51507]|uniref:Uncharacterized protein n=1 Tax=Desulfitobacterium dehalogenans (strain ATCC 51507 / DSM 9161 / JW/IU-DC1) TaxID=756499 RepID=I4A737_DESDJ|nr:hypothetical protein [Desulfitobacterium dehalogenans]AFL99771.1 hypothetical protein Desde_1346 [Desulfitobacterium dehalogenans ATCC 51507]
MQIGRKIYYELTIGDVVLTTLEKLNGINTTKEQDFAMYDALQAYSPEAIGVMQLEYGQYQSDFLTANSWKVDLETGSLIFNYPIFEQPLSIKVEQLESENTSLRSQVSQMETTISNQQSLIDELTLQLGHALLGGAL